MSLLTEIGRYDPPHPHGGPLKPKEKLMTRHFSLKTQVCSSSYLNLLARRTKKGRTHRIHAKSGARTLGWRGKVIGREFCLVMPIAMKWGKGSLQPQHHVPIIASLSTSNIKSDGISFVHSCSTRSTKLGSWQNYLKVKKYSLAGGYARKNTVLQMPSHDTIRVGL